MMIINSAYDSWAIREILQIKCLSKGADKWQYSLEKCSSHERTLIDRYWRTFQGVVAQYLEN